MADVTTSAGQERIDSLDVLRGFALLGILAVNAPYFAYPLAAALSPSVPGFEATGIEEALYSATSVFFMGKFVSLFSMLFGVSVFLIGGERGDKTRGGLLRSRLFWLGLVGLIHGAAIWYGDVLLTYALAGVLMLLARSMRPVALLIFGTVLFALVGAANAGMLVALQFAPPETLADVRADIWKPSPADVEAIVAAYTAADPLSSLTANFRDWVDFNAVSLVFVVFLALGLMMVGLGLFKLGFLSNRAPVWVYVLVLLIGAGMLALIWWQHEINRAAGWPFPHSMGAGAMANTLGAPLVTLGYVSALLLMLRTGFGRAITRPLAAVGRLAFTNYLLTSIVMTTIFYGGRGFGLFGEVTRLELAGIVLAVWVAQLVLSSLYLKAFAMGPFEALWRTLTYGKLVSLRTGRPV